MTRVVAVAILNGRERVFRKCPPSQKRQGRAGITTVSLDARGIRNTDERTNEITFTIPTWNSYSQMSTIR